MFSCSSISLRLARSKQQDSSSYFSSHSSSTTVPATAAATTPWTPMPSSHHSKKIRVNPANMEANFYKQGFTAVDDINDRCLKWHDSRMEETQRPFVGRNVSEPDCSFPCNGNWDEENTNTKGPEPVELKVGFFYEIDHEQLRRKSPIQVEGIRAVLVNDISECRVSVRVPSTLSLHKYFSSMKSEDELGKDLGKIDYPELDKQFVMPPKLAHEILVRKITPAEFMRQRRLRSFWVLPSKATGISTTINNAGAKDETLQKGVCWSYLHSKATGVSTFVNNVGAKEETSQKGVSSSYMPFKATGISTSIKDEGAKDETSLKGVCSSYLPSKATGINNAVANDETLQKGVCWSYLHSSGLLRWGVRKKASFVGKHQERTPRIPSFFRMIKEEKNVKIDNKPKDEMKFRSRKRKREGNKYNKKSEVPKCEVKKLSDVKKPGGKMIKAKPKVSYGWWSQDRYKSAEVKMLEIMKAKGAVSVRPILRHALRMEARKHIGDTGLLDHILKNMADKVAPNGEDRFRRRHNGDGAMEYWLESADLVNVRREAGVKDPYWTPPPGWKPGDNPSQDPNFAWELTFLKVEMTNIKRDLQELHLLKREDEVDKANMISPKSSSEVCNIESNMKGASLQEDYENLVKRKTKVKQQLAHFRRRNTEYSKRNKKIKETKRELKKSSSKFSEKMKLSYGRWSQDRYASAEVKMLEIMKAKGAVHGKPMVRQALRTEARKHIGDTGLLDHILKHMSDKVAPNGLERFRRRHNAHGQMEYWLESSDLVNVRRDAGVKDPYWTPPPGWKPGDNPYQGPNYARELKLLKEEMSSIEKDVQALLSKREDQGDKSIMTSTKSSSESCNLESDTTVASFQEDYENLVKTKTQIEQDRALISESMNEMQDSFMLGNDFHTPLHDAMSTSEIHQMEQESIASYLASPHHGSVDLSSFFRSRPCDFVMSQSLDTEPLLV